MPQTEKERLSQLLTDARRETLSALERVDDLETPIYPDSGWRLRDVLGHVAAWDEMAAAALAAYARGERYTDPGYVDIETFNQRQVQERRDLDAGQVYAGWEAAHRDLRDALDALPPERIEGELFFPWGNWGTVGTLIEVMAAHERGHCRDIVRALGG